MASPENEIHNQIGNNTEDAKFHSGWNEWLICNLVAGSHLEDILEVMRRSGFSDEYADARLRESAQNPMVKGARDAVAVQRKAVDILNALSKLEHKSPFSKQVEVVRNLAAVDFYREYFFKNRPVVLQGITSKWKAVGLWTPEHFASRFGDCQVEVTTGRQSDPHYEHNLDRHTRQMPMRDYVRLVVDGGETNDYYLMAQNYLLARPEFQELYDHITDLDGYLNASDVRGRVRVWFGPKGTITRLHHDAAPILMAQIYGRKQVKLISPVHLTSVSSDGDWLSSLDLDYLDYSRFPKMRNVDVLEVNLAPGELLFLPLGWWHWVKALDVSISVSLDNFCVPRNEIELDWKR